jgi:hypothetical protein
MNPRSYPGTGTSWYDLSGFNSTLSMSGSPSYTSLGPTSAKCFRFTAVNQKFIGTLLSSTPTTDMTIETWIYPETDVQADDRGCLLWLGGGQAAYMSWNKGTRQMSNYWYSHPTEGYWETGAAVSLNSWNAFTAVWNNSTSSIYQWTNGVKTTGTPTVGNASTGTSIQIGQESASRQFAGGIGFMRIYNRALSDTEVTQNFNAARGRYGV